MAGVAPHPKKTVFDAAALEVILEWPTDIIQQYLALGRPLKGYNSVRHDVGWADITYECEVDLQTGEATEIVFDVKP